jgi:hypothetical protein
MWKNGDDSLSFPPLFVVIKVHEAVAIVDFDIQESEQREPQRTGDLRADVVARARHVEGEHFLIFLAQVPKPENRLIGAVEKRSRRGGSLP